MSVSAVELFTPYTTATATFSALPTWMSEMDAERINAYQVYEQIYWNVPETFALTWRGSENSPIYVPTARTIIDTTNRYLCTRPGFIIDEDVGSPDEQAEMRGFVSRLFRRERFWSKFQANKRYGLMRGDWCWHILANEAKPQGRRIKIEPLDPAAYFPVTHPDDPDHIVAVYIVEQFTDNEGDTWIKRQTYKRGADPLNNDGSDTTIYNSVGLFEIEAWQELDDRAVTTLVPEHALPPQITAIPVYHIRNMETPGDPFGSSELRGFERIMAAVNQAISDEELILALEGLGMYETDGGPPRDAQGNVTDWPLGPGNVVEHTQGSSFSRVTGVTSVAPLQDHLKFLINSLKEASGATDAAVGAVDVKVAESGIARYMQLQPMLSKVEERSEPINDTHTQMYFDLNAWFTAYEGADNPCFAVPVWGDPMPENKEKRFEEVLKIVEAGGADWDWGRAELAKIGYDFPSDTGAKVINEKQALARAADPFATRMAGELETDEEEGE